MAPNYGQFIIVLYLSVFRCYVKSEPSCSKYDYEEKLLTKLIKMEFEWEKYKTELKYSLKKLENVKSDFDKIVQDTVKTMLEGIKDINNTVMINVDAIKTLVENIDEMKSKGVETTNQVSFKATMLTNTSPSVGDTLVFTNVLHNTGSGYDKTNGVFTVPVDGIYIFGMTLCPVNKHGIVTGFEVDGKKVTAHALYGGPGHECYSVTTSEVLKKGQQVSLKRLSGYDSIANIDQSDSYRWNMFHGSLIHT